jgi:hypothetical protein
MQMSGYSLSIKCLNKKTCKKLKDNMHVQYIALFAIQYEFVSKQRYKNTSKYIETNTRMYLIIQYRFLVFVKVNMQIIRC